MFSSDDGEDDLHDLRERAAIVFVHRLGKASGPFPLDPGGYFHGMVAKAKTDELNLARTVWTCVRPDLQNRSRHRRAGGLAGDGGKRSSTMSIEEGTQGCNRGRRLFFHQPMAGTQDDLFLHIRRRGTHDNRHGRSE